MQKWAVSQTFKVVGFSALAAVGGFDAWALIKGITAAVAIATGSMISTLILKSDKKIGLIDVHGNNDFRRAKSEAP